MPRETRFLASDVRSTVRSVAIMAVRSWWSRCSRAWRDRIGPAPVRVGRRDRCRRELARADGRTARRTHSPGVRTAARVAAHRGDDRPDHVGRPARPRSGVEAALRVAPIAAAPASRVTAVRFRGARLQARSNGSPTRSRRSATARSGSRARPPVAPARTSSPRCSRSSCSTGARAWRRARESRSPIRSAAAASSRVAADAFGRWQHYARRHRRPRRWRTEW